MNAPKQVAQVAQLPDLKTVLSHQHKHSNGGTGGTRIASSPTRARVYTPAQRLSNISSATCATTPRKTTR